MRQPLTLTPLLRLATKRTRSGQALVLMAAAMIVLIAFVGIATDVSLLFVRFNALRRAVDAASIAVAGQVRTGVDFAKLNTIARQFVQLQGGINPDTVKVETCETDIFDYVKAYRDMLGPGYADDDGDGFPTIPADPVDTAAGRTVFSPLNHVIEGIGQLYATYPNRPKSELCKYDPQKLVRVSAQLRSETVFLTLLGWHEVTLSASTVSQTAVLDVALVIDNSASMSDDTVTEETNFDKYPCSNLSQAACSSSSIYQGRVKVTTGDNVDLYDTNYNALRSFRPFTNATDDSTEAGFGLKEARAITIPSPEPITTDVGQYANMVDIAAFNAQKGVNAGDTINPAASVADLTVRAECMYNTEFLANGWDNGIPRGIAANKMANYGWGGCCNDPTVQSNPPLSTSPVGYEQFPAEGNAQNSTKLAFQNNVSPDFYLWDDGVSPQSVIRVDGSVIEGTPGARRLRAGDWVTYDPTERDKIRNDGDGNFSDLICQPFRQVRDAARRFIRRLDFVRGDRLAIITFSENGQVVCPTYDAEFRSAAYDASCAGDPFIYDQDLAVRTLNFKVGVVHNWGKAVGWQENCRSQQAQYNPAGPRAINYWVISQCQNTNTGGAIAAARTALKGPYQRREAVWVMVMLSDGYANRTPAIGTTDLFGNVNGDVLGRAPTQPVRDWLEVPETGRPASMTASDIVEYCQYRTDPIAGTMTTFSSDRYVPLTRYDSSRCDPTVYTYLRDYFGYGLGATDTDVTRRCLRYGSKPELCGNWYAGTAASETFSYGYCPWSDFCLNPGDPKVSPRTDNVNPNVLTTFQFPQQCFKNPTVDPQTGQVFVGSLPDLEDPPAWQLSGSPPYTPYCADNDPDSRHFCSNSLGWINAYDEDINNNKEPDETTVGATTYCSKYYDADDFARDEADWAGLIQYTDRTPGDFIAMFTIFFSKKDNTGNERPLGENILGVKLMRYISDAGDNGRIDNNLQEFYRHFRGDYNLSNTPTAFVESQGVAAKNGYPYLQYKNGAGIYNAQPGFKDWMDPDQDECSQWDYNEYGASSGFRSFFPGQAEYEYAAKQDCGQYWFANDISKVNRAFTEIAGRLFTRLAR
ncbi:MAG: VWA domain-containing protein [Anaerolineae bacterium]|nr:VWA domain-containing protein [Anaerolineae bacterium]